jgi:hypothetical protein
MQFVLTPKAQWLPYVPNALMWVLYDLRINHDYFPNQLTFVMKCCVSFEVWTEFLGIIYFRGLKDYVGAILCAITEMKCTLPCSHPSETNLPQSHNTKQA